MPSNSTVNSSVPVNSSTSVPIVHSIIDVYNIIFSDADKYYVVAFEKDDPEEHFCLYAKGSLEEAAQVVRELYRDWKLDIANADEKFRNPRAIYDAEFRDWVWVADDTTEEEMEQKLQRRLQIKLNEYSPNS